MKFDRCIYCSQHIVRRKYARRKLACAAHADLVRLDPEAKR